MMVRRDPESTCSAVTYGGERYPVILRAMKAASALRAGPLAKLFARFLRPAEKVPSVAAASVQRSSPRFPVQLPLRVKYGPAMNIEAAGETRDISVGGV